jgi:Mrp family chromosome partitioning ATPase
VDLRDLRVALRRHRLVALAAFGICVLIGVVAAYLPEETYRASATLSVEPNLEASENSPQSAAQLTAFVIPSLVERLGSSSYRESAAESLDPEVSARPVAVRASVDTGTGIVRVRVESRAPAVAAAWANALAEHAIDDPTLEEVDVVLIETARPPREPAEPQRGPIIAASLVLGGIAAVFSALVASRTRRALDPTEEVRARLHIPVLATVPRSRALARSGAPLPGLLQGAAPELVEAFRRLRTAVELSLVEERPEVVAVTSLSAGEGKTTVVVGLGIALASVGHDVAIIDADLRRPAVTSALGVAPGTEGLADWVRRDGTPELRAGPIVGLSYLPAGTPDRHPADAVALALPRALGALSHPGRLVLLDAPPIQGVAESPLVLDAATHVLLVIDAATVRLPELERQLVQLREAGIAVLGAVVNRTRERRNAKDDYYVAALRGGGTRAGGRLGSVGRSSDGGTRRAARRSQPQHLR